MKSLFSRLKSGEQVDVKLKSGERMTLKWGPRDGVNAHLTILRGTGASVRKDIAPASKDELYHWLIEHGAEEAPALAPAPAPAPPVQKPTPQPAPQKQPVAKKPSGKGK